MPATGLFFLCSTQMRQLALQHCLVTDIQLHQTPQVRDAVEIDAVTAQAGAAAMGVYPVCAHADLTAVTQRDGDQQRFVGVDRLGGCILEQHALEAEIQHLGVPGVAGLLNDRWGVEGDAGELSFFHGDARACEVVAKG